MRNLSILFVFIISFLNAQNVYTKIPQNKIDMERQNTVQSFLKEYLAKCSKNDFSSFKNFNISKRMELFLNKDFEKRCKENMEIYGKIELLDFNSAYIHKHTLNYDPLELFIFDVQTEKLKHIKFLSAWIFRDKNHINGIWISADKPLHPKKSEEK